LIHGEKGIMDVAFKKTYGASEADVTVVSLTGGNAVNMVPDSAKAVLAGPGLEAWVESVKEEFDGNDRFEYAKDGDQWILTRIGKSAHGSTPEAGENAVSHLIAFLVGHGIEDPCLAEYADMIGLETDGASFGCKMTDEYGPLTFNLGLFELKEGVSSFRVNVRYPISAKEGDVMDALQSIACREKGWTAEKRSHLAPIYKEKSDDLVQTLWGVYREVTGDQEKEPFTIGGGTYARAMDNVVAFGPGLMGSSHLAHQPNEYIEVEELIALADIYGKAVERLAK
jgi:succinyl-diaminopimelate desuccinylase